jgi:hypothetical protein
VLINAFKTPPPRHSFVCAFSTASFMPPLLARRGVFKVFNSTTSYKLGYFSEFQIDVIFLIKMKNN